MKKYLLYFNVTWSILAFLTVLARSDLSYILLIIGFPVYFFTVLTHLIWGINDWIEIKKLNMLFGLIIVILFYVLAISLLPSGFGRM
jgi:hypothetical protein